MKLENQISHKRGFSGITAIIIATAVIGIGVGAVSVTSSNKAKTDNAATSTATTTNRQVSSSTTEQTGTSSDNASEQSAASQVAISGSVTNIDRSAMAVDGPMKVTVSTDSGSTQTIRLPARSGQCPQQVDIMSTNNLSVGDNVSARGGFHAEEIAPCRSANGYFRIQGNNQQDDESTEADEQSEADMTLTDTFRGHEFTASISQEGDTLWNYSVTGSLPNPCWNYSVEAEPISPVQGNDQQTYRIHVTANPPGEDEMCTQVVQDVEASGSVQDSAANVKFELEVGVVGELSDFPA